MILESARAAIADYRPEDPREGRFQERMLELLELESPASRERFVPGHLTASAFVLSPDGDEVLLILHKKLGLWLQPGGHVEPGDQSLAEAARREVAEEVGLELPADVDARVFDLDIHSIPARKDEPQHEHFDVRFCFRAASRNITTNHEVAGARWVPFTRIDQVTTDESVLRVVRKLMRVSSTQR